MPRLSTSVRIAAVSILLLSIVHVVFWITVASLTRYIGPDDSRFTILHVAIYGIAAAGFAGLAVAVGILKARNWARIATLVLGALTASVCALALFVLLILIANPNGFGLFDNLVNQNRDNFLYMAFIYLIVFILAIWWIVLFSRKRIAEQFSDSPPTDVDAFSNEPKCPPPIALLAWLMILSSALSAVSWPLILGKIPALLFTHIFSPATSKWIWIANIALFLACGAGLLRLQRWSYNGTIFLHIFWLASAFVTQLSDSYDRYWRMCLESLNLTDTYPFLNRFHPSPWIAAVTTAIPTALLIAGLIYYRRSFLQAVADSRHLSS